MKTKILLLAVVGIALATGGCDQGGSALKYREAVQKEIDAKDKTIEELNRKVADLEHETADKERQPAKSAEDPAATEKLATAVTAALQNRLEQQDRELKAKLDEAIAAIRSQAASAQPAPPPVVAPQPVVQPPVSAPAPVSVSEGDSGSTGSSHKYKMVWGDGANGGTTQPSTTPAPSGGTTSESDSQMGNSEPTKKVRMSW